MTLLIVAFCLLAGFSAAVADVLGRRSEYGVLKMLAATAYIAFALHLGANDTVYGRLILGALTLSWFGDLFLIGNGRAFMAGLFAFLLAHVAYAAAFLVRGAEVVPTVIGSAVMVAVALSTLRWLHGAGLPRGYGVPLAAYVTAIGVMVALALGTAWPDLAAGPGLAMTGRAVILGAGAFAVSDILVARERFVAEDPRNRLAGLPLYFAAQLLLAWSV